MCSIRFPAWPGVSSHRSRTESRADSAPRLLPSGYVEVEADEPRRAAVQESLPRQNEPAAEQAERVEVASFDLNARKAVEESARVGFRHVVGVRSCVSSFICVVPPPHHRLKRSTPRRARQRQPETLDRRARESPIRVSVVDHDHRSSAGRQRAVHLGDTTRKVSCVVKTTNGVDVVERPLLERKRERGGLHDSARGIAAEPSDTFAHHRDGSFRDVDAEVVGPTFDQHLSQCSVAKPDLENLRSAETVARSVVLQIRIESQVCLIESGEPLGCRLSDADRARERRTAQLVPELGVLSVEVGLLRESSSSMSHVDGCRKTEVIAGGEPTTWNSTLRSTQSYATGGSLSCGSKLLYIAIETR